MRLPAPGSRLAVALIALLAALVPAEAAFAARSWQPPISPPPGFSFGGLGPAVQFDAEGDISTTLSRPASAPTATPSALMAEC